MNLVIVLLFTLKIIRVITQFKKTKGKIFKHMNLVIVLLFTVRLIEITQFKKTKGKIY